MCAMYRSCDMYCPCGMYSFCNMRCFANVRHVPFVWYVPFVCDPQITHPGSHSNPGWPSWIPFWSRMVIFGLFFVSKGPSGRERGSKILQYGTKRLQNWAKIRPKSFRNRSLKAGSNFEGFWAHFDDLLASLFEGIFGKNVWCFSIWFTKVTSFDGFRC